VAEGADVYGDYQTTASAPMASDRALALVDNEPLNAWEIRCRQGGEDRLPWPAREALALLDSLRHYIVAGNESQLRRAAQMWAVANPTVAVLVRRLSCLRELFDDEGISRIPELNDRFRRALDLVTAVATEQATSALADAALTDTLTGVGNRRALNEAAAVVLEQATQTGRVLSAAVIDLKGLKEINDTQGHAAGDRALAGFAISLRAAMREEDQLFRVGGDEFVVLFPGAKSEAVANVMGRAVRLNAPNFSWGTATFPSEGGDLDSLLALADSRLYKSRHAEGYYGSRISPKLERDGWGAQALTAAPVKEVPQQRRRRPVLSLVGGLAVLAAVVLALVVKPAPGKTFLPRYSPSVSVTLQPDRQSQSPVVLPAAPGAHAAVVPATGPGKAQPATGPSTSAATGAAPAAAPAVATTPPSTTAPASAPPQTAPPPTRGGPPPTNGYPAGSSPPGTSGNTGGSSGSQSGGGATVTNNGSKAAATPQK
jgi:diguanylate cyclase (GGDEF)-like protein